MRNRLLAIILTLSLIAPDFLQAQPRTLPPPPPLTPPPPTVATGQPASYLFHHLDYTNGLLSDNIFSFAQDQKGYMWIGTGKGLQRYDGLRFANYPDTSSADRKDLKIADIFPDEKHNSILYNQFANSLKEWRLLGRQPMNLSPAQLWSSDSAIVYHDSKGQEWLLKTCFSGSKKNEGISILKEPGKPQPYFVYCIKNPLRHETWVNAPGTYGLLYLDEDHRQLKTPADDADSNALMRLLLVDPHQLRKIELDRQGNIWLITWSPFFYRYNTLTRQLHTYSLLDIIRQQGFKERNPGYLTSVLEDDHGRLWIGTANAGLLEYHYDNDQFTWMLHQTSNNSAIHYNHEILSLFQDREENIWVGTDKGISIFNPYRQYFTTICNQPSNPGEAAESEVNAVLPVRSGRLLVGHWGDGVRIYNARMQLQDSLFFKDTRDKNLVWCFLSRADGSTWAGCQHGYIHLLDTASRLIRTIRPPELENMTIRCMENAPDGDILLGLHNGKIVIWDHHNAQFLPFRGDTTKPLPSVLNIFFDKQGRCWAGTLNGLVEFDLRTRSYIARYTPSAGKPSPIYGIIEYNDSILLTGIGNAGLFLFDRRNGNFDRLPFHLEDPFWSAYAIRKDDAGNIWFSTDYDICKYDTAEKKTYTYHPEKSLINSYFASTRFFPMPSGKWLTWTATEVVEFSPDSVSSGQSASATVAITGLRVFDKPVFIDSLLYTNHPLELSYKENFISFQYSFLRYSGFAQTEYSYRLIGIDKEWVHAGGRGYANYTNLPPGKYQFQVRTGGASDIASMDIVIVPPFWMTLWFRLVCLLVIIGLVYGFIRWRIHSVRKEADMQQQIATTEMMALRAQMNPHFIFNCINSIDSLIQSNDKYHATVYLNKFARLIRNILDSSRQNSVPLSKDLETLRLYIELEQLRNGNTFTAEIRADEDIVREDFKVPPLIVQPYVENAILHGLRNRNDNKGRLLIQVTQQEEFLLYTIEDNGVGRAASKKEQLRPSYGMEMSSDRVKLFNRHKQTPVTVTDLHEDGAAAGTRIQVLLKIQ